MPGAGSVKNYVVPIDFATMTKQEEFRQAAIAATLAEGIKQGIGDSFTPPDIRDIQLNATDFVAAPAVDDWETAALAAVGTNYSVFQAIASPQVPVNRVICFYGVSINTIPVPVSRLIFRKGGVTGNIIGEFDLEKLDAMQTIAGFLSQPQVYGPQDIYAVQVRAKIATGALARVILWAFVAEPRGNTIA